MISIITPVYGCKDCLTELHATVALAMDEKSLRWELIFVDDRGPDEPWHLICDLAKKDPRIRGLKLSRNHGQHLAIWAGLEKAVGDWVVVIDCDLQDDPSLIPLLLETVTTKGCDAAIVDRGNWTDTWFRRIASRWFYRFVRILGGVDIGNAGNFGIYSRKLVDTLLRYEEQEVVFPIMVALTGMRTCTVVQKRSDRIRGTSSYNLLRLFRLAFMIIVRFSDRPLRLSILVGAVMSIFSSMVSTFLVISWLLGVFSVPGWTSVLLSIWFLSGLVLATLGVHGVYMGRIFSEAKRRPRIIVDEAI